MMPNRRSILMLLFGIALLSGTYFTILFFSRFAKIDFLIVFLIGSILSAVEMGSRYKDEPISVMTCAPGIFYITVNGLICCVGLLFIKIYGNPETIKNNTLFSSSRVTDVLYASLGSFLIMRSSFLKLGTDSSQIDLGLNLVLKKLVDIIDRQVDRDQASRRSKDITDLLRDVKFDDLSDRVKPLCLQVMQNVAPDELEELLTELKTIESSDDNLETRKLSMGLELYNIVGKKVLQSVVNDLKVSNKPNPDVDSDDKNEQQSNQLSDFKKYFSEIVENLKQK